MQRILAATDLGSTGDAAIRVAHARARDHGAQLAVCHVVSEEPPDRAVLIAAVREQLGAVVDPVEVFVPVGNTPEKICECATTWNADLVVLGRPQHAHGLLSRLFRHHVVDEVLRHPPCQILVTRASPGTGRIVVGTDLDDPSIGVLRAAALEQQRTGGSVHVVHCVPPATLVPIGDPAGAMPVTVWPEIEEAALKRIDIVSREAGLRAAPEVVMNGASHGLVQAATDLAADLVIVGTHARSGLSRLALGSVAQQVVDNAPCPVLVVPLLATAADGAKKGS
jgi:nucleotide-binding universal stress UspA family protein